MKGKNFLNVIWFLLSIFFLASCSDPGNPAPGNDSDGSSTSSSTPGSFDESFNGTGYVIFSDITSMCSLVDLEILPDGKILGLGMKNDIGVLLFRLNSDGTVDTDFGDNNDGFATVPDYLDNGCAMAIQGDGKILVIGSESPFHESSYLVRFNADGSFDSSFNNNQKIEFEDIIVQKASIQDDGKILIAGWLADGRLYDALIQRLNSDGSTDTGFGDNGFFIHSNAAGGTSDRYDQIYDIALDDDGGIYATGCSEVNRSTTYMVTWKVDSTGQLDTTFGDDGVFVYSDLHSWGYGLSLTDDHIYICGAIKGLEGSFGAADGAIFCLSKDGEKNTSFGEGDGVFNNAKLGSNYFYSITHDNLGRILVTGTTGADIRKYQGLRLLSNGTKDPSFIFSSTTVPYEPVAYYDNEGRCIVYSEDLERVYMGGVLHDSESNWTHMNIYCLNN